MRTDWLKFGLLAGALVLGTGAAPTHGVREADRWQREADAARSGKQWDVAYSRYSMLADFFPGTPHGRLGAVRAREMRDWALAPDRLPDSEDPVSWTRETLDFFTWP